VFLSFLWMDETKRINEMNQSELAKHKQRRLQWWAAGGTEAAVQNEMVPGDVSEGASRWASRLAAVMEW
jgi:hypothetical protein